MILINRMQKSRIAVLFYSQSGQLKQILESMTAVFSPASKVDFLEIKPVNVFPFPWTAFDFFDKMPECVQEDGCEVTLEGYDSSVNYDLIIFGYQPWFLSPSMPTTGFLKTDVAKRLFSGKKVVTVIGARNMWLNAQEKVKSRLLSLDAILVGNITFVDTTPNIISTITVIRWAFTGKKEATRWLPQAGIQPAEMSKTSEFGMILDGAIKSEDFNNLHKTLRSNGAVFINPQLILLEHTGITQFRKWAASIKALGPPGDIRRKPLVKKFWQTLFVGIFFLSPLNRLISKVKIAINAQKLKKDMEYFSSVDFHKNAI